MEPGYSTGRWVIRHVALGDAHVLPQTDMQLLVEGAGDCTVMRVMDHKAAAKTVCAYEWLPLRCVTRRVVVFAAAGRRS